MGEGGGGGARFRLQPRWLLASGLQWVALLAPLARFQGGGRTHGFIASIVMGYVCGWVPGAGARVHSGGLGVDRLRPGHDSSPIRGLKKQGMAVVAAATTGVATAAAAAATTVVAVTGAVIGAAAATVAVATAAVCPRQGRLWGVCVCFRWELVCFGWWEVLVFCTGRASWSARASVPCVYVFYVSGGGYGGGGGGYGGSGGA